jgi:hypothetical protein
LNPTLRCSIMQQGSMQVQRTLLAAAVAAAAMLPPV